jgi:hypothetical protein
MHHRYHSHSSQPEFHSILNNACCSVQVLGGGARRGGGEQIRLPFLLGGEPQGHVPDRQRRRPARRSQGALLHLRRAGPLRRRDEAGGQGPPGRLRRTTGDKQRDVRVKRQGHARRQHLRGGRLAADRQHHPYTSNGAASGTSGSVSSALAIMASLMLGLMMSIYNSCYASATVS